MHSPWYLFACILIPAIWGLVVAYVYDRLAARKKRSGDEASAYMDFEI